MFEHSPSLYARFCGMSFACNLSPVDKNPSTQAFVVLSRERVRRMYRDGELFLLNSLKANYAEEKARNKRDKFKQL